MEKFIHPDCKQYSLLTTCDLNYFQSERVKLWGTAALIGMAIGDNAKQLCEASDANALIKRFGDIRLVRKAVYYGDDMDDTKVMSKVLTIEQIAQELIEGKYYKIGVLQEIETLEQLQSVYADHLDSDWSHLIHLVTEDDAQRLDAEERRRKLEESAKCFASTAGVPLGTMEFVHAIHSALDDVRSRRGDWNSGEARAERFGACQYAGVGSEVFFEDNDYVEGQFSSQRDDLEGILEWLRSECPLLMAKYEEECLAGKFETQIQEMS